MTIRAATPADAASLAALHVASWRAGYRGLIPDEFLERLSVDERLATWERLLADDETRVLVAGAPIAGFVAFLPHLGEIRALYVAPSRFREGVGSALLTAAHEEIERDEVVLWVLEGNDAALAFYRRHGYEADGARAIHEPTGADQLRMARQTRL